MPWAAKRHNPSPYAKRQPRKRTDDRPSAAARGYDRKWQKLREWFIQAHPICVMCEQQGRVTPATLVDHITPIADGGERLSTCNLQSLCVQCHSKKTAQDLSRRGRGREN